MHDSSSRKDGWTAEQDEKIVTLRGQRKSWKDVAAAVGRTVESCCSRYRTIVPPSQRKRYMSSRHWTLEEEATLKMLMNEGRKPRQIANFMGKELQVIYSKIQQLRQPGRLIHIEMDPRVHVPPEREADRARRLSAERDITSLLLGDPAPGQSALDKKQGLYA